MNREKFLEICSGLGENWGSFEPNLADCAQIRFFVTRSDFYFFKEINHHWNEIRHNINWLYVEDLERLRADFLKKPLFIAARAICQTEIYQIESNLAFLQRFCLSVCSWTANPFHSMVISCPSCTWCVHGLIDWAIFQLDWFHQCNDFKYSFYLQKYILEESYD